MGWELQGFYVENCNCDAVCPCTWSNLLRPATNDDCRAALAFRIERGSVDDVDVSGRTIVLALRAPKMMVDGNWRAGVVFDSGTTDQQMDMLTKVFTGAMGGPMAGLAPLISEFMGAERADITLDKGDDGWRLSIGDDVELGGTVIRGPESDAPAQLTGITAHPAGPTMTITPSAQMRSSLFGIEFSGDSRSGFMAPFSWAA